MDNLPDESFALILDLVPIRDILVLMQVSKRWTAACRYIKRTRRSPIIGNYGLLDWYPNVDNEMRGWNWHRIGPSEPLDSITVANESLESEMMKSLNRIILHDCVCDTSLKGIRPFVQKLAHQLTMLEIPFAISDVGADVFP